MITTDSVNDLLKKVRAIEIKTKSLSADLFSGEYHSAFKGRGMSFSAVRAYTYGDDIRAIDWNVTARTGEPHVKIFEEERELTVILVVDMSGSSFFGIKKQFKSDTITEICATLAFSASRNNDKVGVVFFTDRVEKFIPPKKGKSHILLIIRELLSFKPQGTGTNIAAALEYMNHVVKKRSIVFLLSDFMSDNYATALNISARRHDFICVNLSDAGEINLPSIGVLPVTDAETGKTVWINTDDARLRNNFMMWRKEKYAYLKTTSVKSGTDLLDISTDDDYIKALLGFFKKRNK